MKNMGVDASPAFAYRFTGKAAELTYYDESEGTLPPQMWRCECRVYTSTWRSGTTGFGEKPFKSRWWLSVAVYANTYVVSKAYDGAVISTMHLRLDPSSNRIRADFSFTGASDTGVLMEMTHGVDMDDLMVNFTVDGEPKLFVKDEDGNAGPAFEFAEVLADTLAFTLF